MLCSLKLINVTTKYCLVIGQIGTLEGGNMCGLVGVFGNLFVPDIKFFKNALIADYVRGVHSTGVCRVDGDEVKVKKLPLDPINFLDLRSVDNLLTVSAKGLFGHNRQATVGSVNAANAHPFTHGTITLMHNGTLDVGVKYKLEKAYDAPSFGTDSELICWLINSYELAGVIKDLEGAFALVWYDTDDESVNIIHNGEREFNMYVTDNRVYWASEAAMLRWVLQRNDLTVKDSNIFSPKIGTHVKLIYKDSKVDVSTQQLVVAEKKPLPSSTHGATGGKHTSGGNVSRLPVPYTPALASHPSVLEEFQEQSGMALKIGTKVYAYVTQETEGRATGFNTIHGTLAAYPWCDVVAYNVPDKGFMNKYTKGIQLEVVRIYKSGGDFRMVCAPSVLKIMKRPDRKAMDRWIDYWDGVVRSNSEKDITPKHDLQPDDKVKGYNGRDVSYKHFERIVNNGCCVCDATLDPVEEYIDRTCHFVGEDYVVCKSCASDEHISTKFGFVIDSH
jgi:hypothetical protein